MRTLIQTQKSQLSMNKAVKKGKFQQNKRKVISSRDKGVNKEGLKSGALESDFIDGKEMGVGWLQLG